MKPDRLVLVFFTAMKPCWKDVWLCSSVGCTHKAFDATAELRMYKDLIFRVVQLMCLFFIYQRPFTGVLQVLWHGCVRTDLVIEQATAFCLPCRVQPKDQPGPMLLLQHNCSMRKVSEGKRIDVNEDKAVAVNAFFALVFSTGWSLAMSVVPRVPSLPSWKMVMGGEMKPL